MHLLLENLLQLMFMQKQQMVFVSVEIYQLSSIYSSKLRKHKQALEKVQKVFTKLLFYRCFPNPAYPRLLPSYEERLKILDLESITYRRVVHDIILAFRIFRGETRLRPSKYWVFRPSHGRTSAFSIYFRHFGGRQRFRSLFEQEFFVRTSKMLQELPHELLACSDSSSFRRELEKRRLNDFFAGSTYLTSLLLWLRGCNQTYAMSMIGLRICTD